MSKISGTALTLLVITLATQNQGSDSNCSPEKPNGQRPNQGSCYDEKQNTFCVERFYPNRYVSIRIHALITMFGYYDTRCILYPFPGAINYFWKNRGLFVTADHRDKPRGQVNLTVRCTNAETWERVKGVFP